MKKWKQNEKRFLASRDQYQSYVMFSKFFLTFVFCIYCRKKYKLIVKVMMKTNKSTTLSSYQWAGMENLSPIGSISFTVLVR
jgi:hypothetical protein